MTYFLPFLAGLVAASLPAFISSIDGVLRWGWDTPFGIVVTVWPVLAILLAVLLIW